MALNATPTQPTDHALNPPCTPQTPHATNQTLHATAPSLPPNSVMPNQPGDIAFVANEDHLQSQHMYQAVVRGTAPRDGGASDPLTRNTCSAVR